MGVEIEILKVSVREELEEKIIVYEVAKKRLDLIADYAAGKINLKELNNLW